MGRARVLVVEDDPVMRALIVDILHSIGIYLISTANNGYQAWAKFEDGEKFDLVISDWVMPVMNGLEVLKNIRASHSATPFIMVTARDTEAEVRRATDCGVTGYITKPLQAADLISEVYGVLSDSGVISEEPDSDFMDI